MTMAFALLELAKQPELQARVRDEIRDKLGQDGLTYERVSEMGYLQQVVSETLRLYPPAPLIDRIAVADYKVWWKLLCRTTWGGTLAILMNMDAK